ncbi:hypothetical protein J6590_085629 [Homalodisca vitripennis]|nr:hypothetical protein J6590_085629 [Homalodisca vitripennis]
MKKTAERAANHALPPLKPYIAARTPTANHQGSARPWWRTGCRIKTKLGKKEHRGQYTQKCPSWWPSFSRAQKRRFSATTHDGEMTAENQLISWTSSPHMSEGKQLSKTNKHLIKQKIKLELLLTCTPRLRVFTPLSRKGPTPSNDAARDTQPSLTFNLVANGIKLTSGSSPKYRADVDRIFMYDIFEMFSHHSLPPPKSATLFWFVKSSGTVCLTISLAVAEVNAGALATRGHSLEFVVAETYSEETTSIRQIAALWTRNVSAYIGPQLILVLEVCTTTAFNLAKI